MTGASAIQSGMRFVSLSGSVGSLASIQARYLSAASKAEIRGRALFQMDLHMIEASRIDAEKFEVRRIEGSLDGASKAILWCTERMSVPLKNASHITYIGHPKVVDCPISDVSTITRK